MQMMSQVSTLGCMGKPSILFVAVRLASTMALVLCDATCIVRDYQLDCISTVVQLLTPHWLLLSWDDSGAFL